MKIRTIILIFISFVLTGCNGCSKSAQKFRDTENGNSKTPRTERRVRQTGKTIVKMEKRNGVYYIPVELNGSKMDFIFDTGAGIISISETEALFLLKQGTLTKDDIIGTANFSDANGDITEGTIINLKTVKIGNVTLTNIQASVVPNSVAPLLLGQSAFEKFGKISIDYKKGEITLE
jgi:aspartyl protease family protein